MNFDTQLAHHPLFQTLTRSAQLDEESCDAIMGHGFLTAQVISPCPDTPEDIVQTLVTSPAATEAETEALIQSTRQMLVTLDGQFNDEHSPFTLPSVPDTEASLLESPLADWCTGFMEVHMTQQDAWLEHNEDAVTELLLPIATLSGLFADEPPFNKLSEQQDLLRNMADQLPELLTELYLLIKGQEPLPE